MCCFCQIPEIRSVCHLRAWPLKPALHHDLFLRPSAALLFPSLQTRCHWWSATSQTPRASLISSSQCHEQRTPGSGVLPTFASCSKVFPFRRMNTQPWSNYDGRNHFISARLSYLTSQKFSYDLDTECVPAEFDSRALTDFNMSISPFLIRIIVIYCWHNNWRLVF